MGKAKEIIGTAFGLAGLVVIARYYPQIEQFIKDATGNGSTAGGNPQT